MQQDTEWKALKTLPPGVHCRICLVTWPLEFYMRDFSFWSCMLSRYRVWKHRDRQAWWIIKIIRNILQHCNRSPVSVKGEDDIHLLFRQLEVKHLVEKNKKMLFLFKFISSWILCASFICYSFSWEYTACTLEVVEKSSYFAAKEQFTN